MNLAFERRFVERVRSGEKRHSIRGGARWKVGMRADLWEQMRQERFFDTEGRQTSGQKLIFRAMVTAVDPIMLVITHIRYGLFSRFVIESIEIAGEGLSRDEMEAFAAKDGFLSLEDMARHWVIKNKLKTSRQWLKVDRCWQFKGQVVYWDYENRFTTFAKTRKRKRAA